jgi:DNA-binding NarL/FixJ family response regulator
VQTPRVIASHEQSSRGNRFTDVPRDTLEMNMPRVRVLVADDFDTVRKGVCAILSSREGIEVCAEAANGEEAVRKARELKPDVVIMDFSMPVMDGLEASKKILQAFPGMAILMFSMHKTEALTQAAKNAGVSGFVTKGESAQNLLQAVDSVMRKVPFFELES